jgi:catalase
MDGQVTLELTAAIALHRHWDRINLEAIPA